jgi:hypothetical protein
VPKLRPDDETRLRGDQLRAARGLLDISAEKLAEKTKLGLKTIRRAEQEDGPVPLTRANVERLISVLQEMGIQFVEQPDGAFGVVRSPKT